MKHWKTALICVAAALAPTLSACTAGGAVAGGVAGHELTHSTAGTIGGAAAGAVIGHELEK
ncbi:glycine zipper 2TM domain-containing protein [Ralstonia soli]|uniref:Glycine zipper 2TM domain-containing protein n=1 Tax=Ralstonia soli TaxID=2953896 RepID=A0ABT1ALX1_9RALS|nr:glycine zipper 2TM domain-containing protein [Ralstonia soli]MCO5399430.1 glycine zipper 2TM domain-containing protein [Ralstonia soli]